MASDPAIVGIELPEIAEDLSFQKHQLVLPLGAEELETAKQVAGSPMNQ